MSKSIYVCSPKDYNLIKEYSDLENSIAFQLLMSPKYSEIITMNPGEWRQTTLNYETRREKTVNYIMNNKSNTKAGDKLKEIICKIEEQKTTYKESEYPFLVLESTKREINKLLTGNDQNQIYIKDTLDIDFKQYAENIKQELEEIFNMSISQYFDLRDVKLKEIQNPWNIITSNIPISGDISYFHAPTLEHALEAFYSESMKKKFIMVKDLDYGSLTYVKGHEEAHIIEKEINSNNIFYWQLLKNIQSSFTLGKTESQAQFYHFIQNDRHLAKSSGLLSTYHSIYPIANLYQQLVWNFVGELEEKIRNEDGFEDSKQGREYLKENAIDLMKEFDFPERSLNNISGYILNHPRSILQYSITILPNIIFREIKKELNPEPNAVYNSLSEENLSKMYDLFLYGCKLGYILPRHYIPKIIEKANDLFGVELSMKLKLDSSYNF